MIENRSLWGFSLIEVLLVIVIAGVLMAVVIPRAWRANVEARYGMVRQNAVELTNWGKEWAQRSLEAQGTSDTCNLDCYVRTLLGYVGDSGSNNWAGSSVAPKFAGSATACSSVAVYSVSSIMPPEKPPLNPFNGASYFLAANDGTSTTSVPPGLLYLGSQADPTGCQVAVTCYDNFYFVYTGTGSTGPSVFYAGMGSGTPPPLANLRNGVFMARLHQ